MTPGERRRREIDEAVGARTGIRPFTVQQRRALIVIVGLLLLCIAISLLRYPATIPDPMPVNGALAGNLLDRLDPNTADAVSLSALPTMGLRRAEEIVAYRERIRAMRKDPDYRVFENIDDLMRVRGIGHATARQAEPFLEFPTTSPASLPAK